MEKYAIRKKAGSAILIPLFPLLTVWLWISLGNSLSPRFFNCKRLKPHPTDFYL